MLIRYYLHTENWPLFRYKAAAGLEMFNLNLNKHLYKIS